MTDCYQEIIETLQAAYPGQIFLSVTDFSNASGLAAGTVYNRIGRKSEQRLDIPVIRIGNRPKFRIHDVARYLAEIAVEGQDD